ncbi:MAG: thioredoxin [Clostridiales bacterium]|nr:thioredoxin [Clostridiales bacterium]
MNGGKPALVDFWATWCGPCRMIGPEIEELAVEYDGRAEVCKVNVDDEKALAKRFRIMSIPCVILFKDGQELNRLIGARDKSEYADALEEIMG